MTIKAKRRLKNVHFKSPTAHIAYTNWEQGGACSLFNDPILIKSLLPGKELTEYEKELLAEMGHDLSELSKSLIGDSEKTSGDSPQVGDDSGKEPKTLNTKDTEMAVDKENQDRITALEKALAKSEAKAVVQPYGFEDEISKGLVEAMAELKAEDQTKVQKALDAMSAKLKEAESKVTETVEKAKGTPENEIAKALSEEKGHDEKAPGAPDKTVFEKAIEKAKAANQGAK